ncbi:MAG: sugar ABC transporter substrate-binding protein [Treponema sp.]|nr:sugar ABC transporter substrate-binding protein [Treponema sp.]
MKMVKKALTAGLVAVLLVTVLACNRSAGTTEDGAGGQLELAMVPPAMVSPFYAAVLSGARPEAEKLGYKLTILSTERDDDAAGQVKIVEDLVQRGVAGIAICAHDDKAIVSAVIKANQAGIPIVIFNSLTDLPGGEVYAYVGYDQRQGGANIADWVNKVTNGQANVAILEGLPGFHSTERAGGFIDQIKKYPGIKVVATQPADWAREKGLNVATNMLQADGSINAFYGLNDEMSLGAGQAIRQMGLSGIVTVGIDGNPNAMEAVKNGDQTATLYVNPVGIGAGAIDMLDAALKNQPAPAGKRLPIDTIVVDTTLVDQYL